jgi:putative hydrolase of the HAD superfamily
MHSKKHIPYSEIDTLFLDAGGTLISIDFEWICKELSQFDIMCHFTELQRAESAAKPIVSVKLSKLGTSESFDAFELYLHTILEQLLVLRLNCNVDISTITKKLAPILRSPGQSQRLWSYVLPGVRNALRSFAELGLKMIVVSNSDGTLEQILSKQGLREFFNAVIDSKVVGYEKPDRRIFDHAMTVAGAQPARTLHIGDMYFSDIVGAQKAGIHAVLLDPYDDWGDQDCLRLPDLKSLEKQLKVARINRLLPK